MIVNKADLGIDAALAAELADYAAAGYGCVEVSAHTGAGLDALLGALGAGATLPGRTVGGRQILARAASRAATARRRSAS